MEKVAFLRKLEPTEVEIAGAKVRLNFTMHAAARMEEELGKPYVEIVEEMLQLPKKAGEPVPPMAIERQMTIVCILMAEAGQVADPEELRQLHMLDFARLCRAAQHEMLNKNPTGSAKKNDLSPKDPSAGRK